MFDDLVFKLANEDERARAFALREQTFLEELGQVGYDPLDEVAHHLVACRPGGEVVATFRILGPEHRPFDFEKLLDMERVLTAGRTPGMVARLCIRKDYRTVRRSTFMQMGILKLSHDFAISRGITDLFMYTFPHLLKFYRGIFFDSLGVSFEHPVWGTVHLMHQDVAALPENCRRSRSSLARALFTGEHPNFIV